jgi:hypothetical protein
VYSPSHSIALKRRNTTKYRNKSSHPKAHEKQENMEDKELSDLQDFPKNMVARTPRDKTAIGDQKVI